MGINCKICCPYCKQVITQIYFCSHLLGKCKEAFLKNELERIKKTDRWTNYYDFTYNKEGSMIHLNFATKVAHKVKKEEYCKKNGSLHREAVKKLLGEEDNKEEIDPQPLISNTDERGWTPREQALLHILCKAKLRELQNDKERNALRKELEAERRKDDLEDDYTDTEEEQEDEEDEDNYCPTTDSRITNRFPELLEDGLLLAYRKFK